MCDGCTFLGNHPSQIYHIRSLSNPEGCMIPSTWKEEAEGQEEGDEEEGKKKAEIPKKEKEKEKDVSPLLFGNLSKSYADLWKNFKEEKQKTYPEIEYNVAPPLPLGSKIRECGCCNIMPEICGRKGNRNYYEHQFD